MSKGRPDPTATRRRTRTADAGYHSGTVPEWAELVRPFKTTAMAHSEGGEMPPVAIAVRKGVVEAVAIAPQVDKALGLDAAYSLRRTLDPDELLLGLDAHVFRGKDKGAYDEARKSWPGGLMQAACDQQGACAKGELMDCVIVNRVLRGGRLMIATLGYHYHGRGSTFRWDDKPWWVDDRGGAVLREHVPDSLKAIMRGPTLLQTAEAEGLADPLELAAMRELMRRDPERCRAIAARAAFAALTERGYLVICEQGLAAAGASPERPDPHVR